MGDDFIRCRHCGNLNRGGSEVCSNCNTPLSGDPTFVPSSSAEREDIFEKSRAFEAREESAEEKASTQEFSRNLETFDDALDRSSKVTAGFKRQAEARSADGKARPVPPAEKEKPSVRPPRSKSVWEKSDTEITASLKRKQLTRDLASRALPISLLAALVLFGGHFFLIPYLMPQGTWEGSVADDAGGVMHFLVKMERSGISLQGQFWLTDCNGRRLSEVTPEALPFLLQGVFDRSPMGVEGSFSRRDIRLTVYPISRPEAKATLTLDGSFVGLGRIDGRAVNYRGVQGKWTFIRKSIHQ